MCGFVSVGRVGFGVLVCLGWRSACLVWLTLFWGSGFVEVLWVDALQPLGWVFFVGEFRPVRV